MSSKAQRRQGKYLGPSKYWNCNADIRSHRRSGIGMIHHSDTEKRAELTKALDYLIKADQEVLIRSGRSMGHGQVEEKPMVGPVGQEIHRPRHSRQKRRPLTYLPDDSRQPAIGSLERSLNPEL